jgi:hypothetical protein
VKTLSELVQCGSEQPMNREVCYSYGECSYDSRKEHYSVWIGVIIGCVLWQSCIGGNSM